MTKKDNSIFLRHILESIEAIGDFSKGLTFEELCKNRLKRSAIVRELEIVGEATKNIDDQLKIKYKEIAWREIAGTRDMIVHKYFGVNLEIIWDIIKKDLPKLKKQISRILDSDSKSQ